MAVSAVRIPASVGRSALVEPFRSPGYRSFWGGNALAQAADQLQIVALAILALDLTHSAATCTPTRSESASCTPS